MVISKSVSHTDTHTDSHTIVTYILVCVKWLETIGDGQ